jgi:hypothetical protein
MDVFGLHVVCTNAGFCCWARYVAPLASEGIYRDCSLRGVVRAQEQTKINFFLFGASSHHLVKLGKSSAWRWPSIVRSTAVFGTRIDARR